MTQKSGLQFDTSKAQQYSNLGAAPKIIEDGYIEKFLARWMSKWTGEGSVARGEETKKQERYSKYSEKPTEKRKRDADEDIDAPAEKRIS